jgi:hypothetical protein
MRWLIALLVLLGSLLVPTAALARDVGIPAVGVTAPVRPLGLAADGTMRPPAGDDLAGWYQGSPAPGAPGPAVIAGHVDSRHGPAVFFRLRERLITCTGRFDRAAGSYRDNLIVYASLVGGAG